MKDSSKGFLVFRHGGQRLCNCLTKSIGKDLAEHLNIGALEMANKEDFEPVLEFFETHGWKLQKIYEPYRVFIKQGELPWLIPVHDKKVDAEYVKKFKEFLQERGEL